jgi:hypothetical protein
MRDWVFVAADGEFASMAIPALENSSITFEKQNEGRLLRELRRRAANTLL